MTPKLPFLPEGRAISYVSENNEFMQAARKAAEDLSLDKKHRTGAVIVKNDEVLVAGANGARFHKIIGCIRKLFNAPTGKWYVICPGCSPKNHAEQTVIRNAKTKYSITEIEDSDLYLWGHWWCCELCWKAMIDAKIKNVFLCEGAFDKFNGGRK